MKRSRRNKILYRFKRMRDTCSDLIMYLGEVTALSEGRPERLNVWADTAVGMVTMLARFFEKMEGLYRGGADLPLPSPEQLVEDAPEDSS